MSQPNRPDQGPETPAPRLSPAVGKILFVLLAVCLVVGALVLSRVSSGSEDTVADGPTPAPTSSRPVSPPSSVSPSPSSTSTGVPGDQERPYPEPQEAQEHAVAYLTLFNTWDYQTDMTTWADSLAPHIAPLPAGAPLDFVSGRTIGECRSTNCSNKAVKVEVLPQGTGTSRQTYVGSFKVTVSRTASGKTTTTASIWTITCNSRGLVISALDTGRDKPILAG